MNILRNFLAASAALALICAGFQASAQKQSPIKLKTVVIDPGHGGKDFGCTSKDGKVNEKSIVLDIGKRLKRKIEDSYDDVNVVMTRDKDYFVTLQGRADIANENNANLFISIHVNSVEGKRTGPNGYSIHTLGQYTSKKRDLYAGNMDVVRRENSVIMLEDDYTTTYQGFNPNDPESYIFMNLMQNAYLEQSLKFAQYVDREMKNGAISESRGISQDPFYVLWKTAMPAVLIECGFMSNPSDRAALNSGKGREKIATEIYDAFVKYKKGYDGTAPVKAYSEPRQGTVAENHEDARAEQSATEEISYGTQVLASSKSMNTSDPIFKGYECKRFVSGKLYKYVVGISNDKDEAKKNLKEIKKYFPDCFLVQIENNSITPEK
ncbi:MAG: N-acetylmuramoyl-L-alanine amidase [Bacteroidales bacterium]|nr:N-acetylmuramoyl-L-alanine amidase [Bacteroidales bacterium]MDY6001044.1 N-acetylmuramoyl-L-alanine amidase [Candidatus Cryptobacteroides sp.]